MSNEFDSLLSAYAKQPLNHTPGPSTREIWSEIERRRAQSLWSRIASTLDLPDLFAEPRMAVAALAFAMLVGIVPAAMASRVESERQLARQSIHFEVFTVGSNPLAMGFTKAPTTGLLK